MMKLGSPARGPCDLDHKPRRFLAICVGDDFHATGTIRRHVDAAGNLIPYWAWATQRALPGRTLMVDVYFVVLS